MGRSLLGTGVRSENSGTLFFAAPLLALDVRCSEALWAGEEAGSALRAVEGVEGEDFWKKPRMDFWLRMFWALEVVRFNAPEGGVAVVGEDAAGAPLAILS